MSVAFLLTWMMVFMRSVGVILQLPVLSNHPMPVTVRLGGCRSASSAGGAAGGSSRSGCSGLRMTARSAT